jgi:phosphatidylglycerol lysyltransferase
VNTVGGEILRAERRRVRWFFAGLLVVAGALDIVGALIVHHQTRTQVLETLLPTTVTLGGRTGAVLSGIALLLLAGGIARGKRLAFRLTVLVLGAGIAFALIKDLDFEGASLFAWILLGLWWFRHHFDADSDPAGARWGLVVLGVGVLTAIVYALVGAALLGSELRPEVGLVRTLESLLAGLAGSPAAYRALTERADWFLGTLPVVSYALIFIALLQLLRPVLAPRAAAADRERLRDALRTWGHNYISHLAVHGASSYLWLPSGGCVAYTVRGRTALALGDPIGPPDSMQDAASAFVAHCERQDWIPAFYQVDDGSPYRALALTLVPVGAEAVLPVAGFGLGGKKRADLRYALRRCEKVGVRFAFVSAPQALADYREQLEEVSGSWLRTRRSPELSYSLGTLSSLADPDVVVGLAFAPDGRLEAFVSWLPVPMRRAWTLDLMRRRPDSTYGVIEALIVRSIEEGRSHGLAEVSLGMTPRIIASDVPRGLEGALRAMFWGLDRFQRRRMLHRYKDKFGPRWEERYLVVPSMSCLPEVMVALVRAHLPRLELRGLGLALRGRLRRSRPERNGNPRDGKDRAGDQGEGLGQMDAKSGVKRVRAWPG